MGLEKAKSLLPVKDGKTFLDLIAEQVVYTREKFGSKVRFILMNRYAQPVCILLQLDTPTCSTSSVHEHHWEPCIFGICSGRHSALTC